VRCSWSRFQRRQGSWRWREWRAHIASARAPPAVLTDRCVPPGDRSAFGLGGL
jgi:hypothetical protein